METTTFNKITTDFEFTNELIKLVGQTYEKFGEYKYALKNSSIDPKIVLNLFLINECYSSIKIDDELYSFDDVIYSNYMKSNNKVKIFKNLFKLYNYSIVEIKNRDMINTAFINSLHKQLYLGMRGTSTFSGSLRKKQNYITKTGLVGKSVTYIPPKVNEVKGLMKDFAEHISEIKDEGFTNLSLMHYNFESIHPYMHGNGLLGRVFISAFFTKYKNEAPILFLSETFKNSKMSYYSIFNESRNKEEIFIKFFLQSIIEQCNLNIFKIEKLNKIYENDLKLIKENTSGSLVYKMLPFMVKRVVFTTNDMIKDTHYHINSINKVLNILVNIGILERDKKEGNNRKTYKYTNIYEVFK